MIQFDTHPNSVLPSSFVDGELFLNGLYCWQNIRILSKKNPHKNDFRQNLQLKTYQNEGRITN